MRACPGPGLPTLGHWRPCLGAEVRGFGRICLRPPNPSGSTWEDALPWRGRPANHSSQPPLLAGFQGAVDTGQAAWKFSGLWYVVSMVSDCKVFLGKKDHLLMSTRDIKASAGGNLSVHMEFPRADGCNQADAEYLRVGAQGHFRVPALGYLDVRVVDTDYSSFAVVYIYKELEGALSTMVQLYSRTQEASPQALEAFQDFYPTVGLPADMVAMLPKSDVCSPGDRNAP
ncbi:lipocalin-15 isoform X1 [Bubalus bubalis]|uniref:lipocalin-15 isoform X1 n=1 Tax=Bubalus bubalis TaxID=89462 RepID=UPI001E1B655F|nr:lipocalin-15 isoform X1 [Bubalus bubalis]XP_045018276.1 lipocalin-15 isoform X1 [Bubalus bubalis]